MSMHLTTPEEKKFTFIDIEGIFSNIDFYLLEYGKFEVTNLFDTPSHTILVKDKKRRCA